MESKILSWIEESAWLKFAVKTQLLGDQSDSSVATHDLKIQTIINRIKDSNVGIPALYGTNLLS